MNIKAHLRNWLNILLNNCFIKLLNAQQIYKKNELPERQEFEWFTKHFKL